MKQLLFIFLLIPLMSYGQPALIKSTVYHWNEDLISDKSVDKPLFEGSSDGFEYLLLNTISLKEGKSYKLPTQNRPVESLVIMKSGRVMQKVGTQKANLGTGSITLSPSGAQVEIKNKGNEKATVYVIQWRTHQYEATVNDPQLSEDYLIDWDTIQFVETSKGGRRSVIRKPTPMLKEFEMHVTTLNEGERSHLPHTHLDEEIILVRYGEVEESIDGELSNGKEGSLIFLRSMVPHGIRNIGNGPCEYYAFRWIPR